MTTKISESNRLPELATQIHTTYTNALAAIEKGITEAMACGDALTEAKALVPHGQWTTWLKENTQLSERSAQRYMQLSRERPTLEAKTATVADLTIRGACELVASLGKNPESWRPMPDDGFALLGTEKMIGGQMLVAITESTYAGFFHFTAIWLGRDDTDCTLIGFHRPVAWDFLPLAAKTAAGVDLESIEFERGNHTGPVERCPLASGYGMPAS